MRSLSPVELVHPFCSFASVRRFKMVDFVHSFKILILTCLVHSNLVDASHSRYREGCLHTRTGGSLQRTDRALHHEASQRMDSPANNETPGSTTLLNRRGIKVEEDIPSYGPGQGKASKMPPRRYKGKEGGPAMSGTGSTKLSQVNTVTGVAGGGIRDRKIPPSLKSKTVLPLRNIAADAPTSEHEHQKRIHHSSEIERMRQYKTLLYRNPEALKNELQRAENRHALELKGLERHREKRTQDKKSNEESEHQFKQQQRNQFPGSKAAFELEKVARKQPGGSDRPPHHEPPSGLAHVGSPPLSPWNEVDEGIYQQETKRGRKPSEVLDDDLGGKKRLKLWGGKRAVRN